MTKRNRIFLAAFFVLVTGQAVAARKGVAKGVDKGVATSAGPEQPATGAATDPSGPQAAPDDEMTKFLNSLPWTVGPGQAVIGDQAEIAVPEGARFTGADGTRRLLEMMHNPTDGSELGLLTTDTLDWFIVFEYEAIGYVKDADKEKLDAAEILNSLRKGNEAGNEERKRRGWSAISIVGWHTPPFYNRDTHNLEWCIKGSADGRDIVNYNTRILGRGGVMSANLLVAPEELDVTLPKIKGLLQGFSYTQGQRYSEWKSGDRIAKVGLSALVVGGAVGLAAKMGLLAKIGASIAKLWKVVIVGVLGALAALKGFIFGKQKNPPSDKQG
jgi:uncharacterized membrane-anchored protein